MPDLQPLLDQLSAVHPAWAALIAVIGYVLRSKGWLRMPGSNADPLSARLQAKAAERYDKLAAGGQPEEAFYFIFTQLKGEPKP